MRNAPIFTDDTIVFGILMLLLGLVFYTSGKEEGFWKKFYGVVPALLMCYLLPAILNSFNCFATMAFKVVMALAQFAEEPTALNSHLLPVKAKGEVLFLSVLS